MPQIARARPPRRVAVLVRAAGRQVADVLGLELEHVDGVVVPRADPERAVEGHEHLVAAMGVLAGDLARPDLEQRGGQVLRAGEDAAQDVEVAAPEDVAGAQDVQPPLRRGRGRPGADLRVVGVAAVLEVGLLPGIRARRARRGRGREQLEHPQRLGAVSERMVPRVTPEEDLSAGLDALDLARLGVRDHERALRGRAAPRRPRTPSGRPRSGGTRRPAASPKTSMCTRSVDA